jgi:hypothetical protein
LPPRIFFSDLESGPNDGGENNAGAFVTIYGRGFGATQGASSVRVGGELVYGYGLWSDTRVTFQLGHAAASGGITLTNDSGTSNAIPFAVRAGRIYYVSTAGDDSNPGTPAAPWRSIPHAVQTSGATPGNITYVLDGVSATGDDGEGWDAALTLRAEWCAGTASNPNALVAYPGATVTIGNPNGTSPGSGLRGTDFTAGGGACPGGWVFAGIRFRGVGPVGINGPSSNWRFVGNDISNSQATGGGGGGAAWEASQATYVKFFGNNVHDTGGAGDRLWQAVYPSTDSNHVDIGWNTIQNTQGRAGIQIHSSPLIPGTGYAMYDIAIHDNVIHDIAGEGIIIDTVDPSQGAVKVYNNVIWNTGLSQGGNAIYGATSIDFDQSHGVGSGFVEIFNNTLYAWNGGAGFGSYFEVHNGQSLVYRLRNNLMYSTGQPYWDPFTSGGNSGWHECTPGDNPTTCPNFTGSNNLVYGDGPETFNALLSAEASSDPLLVNPLGHDFHLQPGSPAANGGTTTAQTWDFDGIPLPQGPAYPIGALANVSGGAQEPVAVAVSPTRVSLDSGEDQQFAVAVSGTSNTGVAWSIVPEIGTLSPSGHYTAPTRVWSTQTVVITATSVADGTKSATATVLLRAPQLFRRPGRPPR